MRNAVYFLLLIAAILCAIGACEKSSVTGLDLTTENYAKDFKHVMNIGGDWASFTVPEGETLGILVFQSCNVSNWVSAPDTSK